MKPFVPGRHFRHGTMRMPKHVREWATLYTSGWTLERIAADTGWVANRPGRRRPGQYSPSAVRNELKRWGVEMRKQGGRGSLGSSALVRIAELEIRMRELERFIMEDAE